ncbi:XVIPCD domain-containing protein [Xanthomonas campestris]|uniref:XVIPCD domain-containing protein n=2 Tax=Xanthomonas campestris TaxID=339 RepID=UPI0009BDF950|nr:XVIPCD domain-containing protein [Xanthomonas campestris]MEB1153569.1 XVIPCD domain-containing protein [Xanthomonas campestris pv. campestris]MCC5099448.1 hypothetical protein [Xanthomonas campestris]MEA9585661.1 XVIPCD domain-containing protein [Xanthomonas campestris]MEA9594136.1 XVIPCD domain-containing protein [Xanthomonas campestris]MEA9625560.1 XVIPCD domain-containing protein [Xanthomonas campestris]
MKSPETHYTVTIYVAAPGTPLAGGGASAAGHVYYSVSDGKNNNSYGFAPLTHGESSGPGGVSTTDVADYKDPYYSRTLEISKDQYETLKAFGRDAAGHGFNMEYAWKENSCIDFTWSALNQAGLHRRNVFVMTDKDFEGQLKPLSNVEDIKSIKAPIPDSKLNGESHHPMPKQTFEQRFISEQRHPDDRRPSGLNESLEKRQVLAGGANEIDPLVSQAEAAVRDLEKGLGRDYDENSARLAASSAYLAKENGLSRIDHVVLSRQTDSVRQGENVFVVEGALNDPAHKMAHMKTMDAITQPVEQSLAQLQTLSETQRSQLQTQQQQEQQHDQIAMQPHRTV